MSSVSEKIIERIRALLKLASNNPSEEEAASAAAMAARMMAEHDLEQAEIEASGETVEAEPIEEGIANPDDEGKRSTSWKGIIMWSVARLFGVKTYGARRGLIALFGRRTAVQTAGYTFRYLANEVEEQAQRYWRLLEVPTDSKTRTLNDFRLGAAGRLQDRMEEMKAKQDNDRQASEGALVVLARKDEEQDHAWKVRAKQLGITGGSKQTAIRGSSATEAGKAAGDRMHIHGGAEQRGLRSDPLRLGAAS